MNNNFSILVVDDSPLALELLKDVLTAEGLSGTNGAKW